MAVSAEGPRSPRDATSSKAPWPTHHRKHLSSRFSLVQYCSVLESVLDPRILGLGGIES